MSEPGDRKASASDRYVNPRRLAIAVGLFEVVLLMPIPPSMRDVAVDHAMSSPRQRRGSLRTRSLA